MRRGHHPGTGRGGSLRLRTAPARNQPRAVLPGRHRRRESMTAYLSFEWLKFSKRWMPRIILLLLLALLVFGFWGQGTRVEDQVNLVMPRAWLAALVFSGFFAPFFWPVLGGSWAGNEYGWGTIRTRLTRRLYRVEQP